MKTWHEDNEQFCFCQGFCLGLQSTKKKMASWGRSNKQLDLAANHSAKNSVKHEAKLGWSLVVAHVPTHPFPEAKPKPRPNL